MTASWPGQRYVLLTGVTLKGSCSFPEPLTVGVVTPVRFQTISFSVNEKLKDSRRRDRTTSADNYYVDTTKGDFIYSLISSSENLKPLNVGHWLTGRSIGTVLKTHMQARPPPEKVILIHRSDGKTEESYITLTCSHRLRGCAPR